MKKIPVQFPFWTLTEQMTVSFLCSLRILEPWTSVSFQEVSFIVQKDFCWNIPASIFSRYFNVIIFYVIIVLELIGITRITMFDAWKTSEERFQTPWTHLSCMWSADTHFWGTHINRGGYFIMRGKLDSFLCKAAVTHSCWIMNSVGAKKCCCL